MDRPSLLTFDVFGTKRGPATIGNTSSYAPESYASACT